MIAHYRQKSRTTTLEPAFTIVELLIVIVVIAILAAISFVAYSGIQDRAETAALESDLTQAAKQLSMDEVTEGSLPSGNGTPPESLTSSTGTTFEYTSDGTSYCLSAVNGTKGYHITSAGVSEEGVCPGHSGPESGGGTIVVACSDFEIGDTGPAGGIIYYKDNGTCYEAAPNGWHDGGDDPIAVWGCHSTYVSGADGTAVGTGRQNTANILAANCPPSDDGYGTIHPRAVDLATSYNGGGKSDWFLPSRMELYHLHTLRDTLDIDGYTGMAYWSSSQVDAGRANKVWFVMPFPSVQTDIKAIYGFDVRPIRSFSD